VLLYGIDGCRDGWVAAIREGAEVSFEIFSRFPEVIDRVRGRPAIVAVDVPIGLPAGGPRACDRAARAFLGVRRSSVFPAPCRDTLQAISYEDACARESQARGKRLTRQTYAILKKIREVDDAIDPALQDFVREAHPEVTFAVLSGRRCGLEHGKKTRDGRAQRSSLLAAALGRPLDVAAERTRLGRGRVGLDDLLDAVACLATAQRIQEGRAMVLPGPEVERDARSFRMEIVA
jgi:predicted RNase H-like nuclease